MMRESIRWLSLEEVQVIHQVILQLDGGRRGVRDQDALVNLLERAPTERLSVSLFRQAAAYCYDIVRTKPFVDANKRTGLVAALTFLELNDRWPSIGEDLAFDLVILIERGRLTETELAEHFR